MAVFDRKSRYVKPALEVYSVIDRRGREVKALPMIEPPREQSIGEYVKKQGQRLDHLANSLVADPNGYWRIAEVNGVLVPDALEEVERLKLPGMTR
jgi:hypothetical protein